MRVERADPSVPKGWYTGPWDSSLDISIGYANEGVDEPHLHHRIAEVYCIARGTAQMRVNRETVLLRAGEAIVVEPGEAHTFVSTSPDYFHFVIQVPGLVGDEARRDKVKVSPSRLGL
jgi:mannose-6-phosphate isomerase-like protein (cupin superfamily)